MTSALRVLVPLLLSLVYPESLVGKSAESYCDRLLLREIREIKNGMSQIYTTQMEGVEQLQKLRFQGLKSQKGIIRVYKDVRKLAKEFSKLQRRAGDEEPPPCESESSDATEEIIEPVKCPRIFEEVRGLCVFIGKDKKTWIDAQQFCRLLGADLLSGENETTVALVSDYLKQLNDESSFKSGDNGLWVGGQLVGEAWVWKTTVEDSPKVSAAIWSSGEPLERPFTPYPLCLFLDGNDDFRGKSSFCKHYRNFICLFK